ncbi:PREDICTED: uncharacterized protein LOC108374100 [Rhagoletis zephyria]|uniref:uncharacterized protein LOC108374100 n=1 Tax=Rhagoletis zephyria TaxID=28612 RepID=UPI0008115880|nr:PREDICTED: uncharacterized protein LOC108374100 [Rhagoletis zephyria]
MDGDPLSVVDPVTEEEITLTTAKVEVKKAPGPMSTSTSANISNEEIMETLKVVLKTQNDLIEGINIINHNQTTIVQNQIHISEVLEQVQQNAVNKSEMEAQNMMV